MTGKTVVAMIGMSLLFAGVAAPQQKPEEIPDAPSASRPVPPPTLPRTAPPANQTPEESTSSGESSSSSPESRTSGEERVPASDEPPRSTETSTDTNAGAPPAMPPVRTVPEGSVPQDAESSPDDLYKIIVTPTNVVVPVTVKDNDGRLVNGLLPKDFVVLENGKTQTLNFFSSSAIPLSVAVVFDLGMPDVAVRKIQETLPALEGAFSQFDEVAIYTYSSTVSRVSDFANVNQRLTAVLNQLKTYSGANSGPPVTGGPLGPTGPIINGRPIDQQVQPVITPPRTARVTNDAILMAARDLSRRERTRRKIIFVISDGREMGSDASYADTLKVLLTQNIIVYAVGVDSAAIPGYGKLQKIHLPKIGKFDTGYGNILPKYVSATGGGTVFAESAKVGIERAYTRAIGDARNQYTLAYAAKPGAGGYREIEVRVRRPDVKVYAKAGYYPLPVGK